MSPITIRTPVGATPLDPDEIEGLIPDYISRQSELDALEQQNILKAEKWIGKRAKHDVLDDLFIREVHRQMFGEVWRWAGKYRKTEKHIGNVAPEQVATEVKKLGADTAYWIEAETYSWDELAARFHHRLVYIHAFANGNGRHARMMTDLLLRTHGQLAFSWGAVRLNQKLIEAETLRKEYIAALRQADKENFMPLIQFVRS